MLGGSEVSAHYFVFEDGSIVQMVPEARRAWHAGASSWAGETDINSCSIGIEIANPGHDYGYPDFPKRQIAAVTRFAAASSRAAPSGRSACSPIPTSRRRASRIPARNFPGELCAIQASGTGSGRRRSKRARAARARRQRRGGDRVPGDARRVRLRHRRSAASTIPPPMPSSRRSNAISARSASTASAMQFDAGDAAET